MVQVTYRKRTQGKTYLHSGSMTPYHQGSQDGYNRQRGEFDRLRHFGNLPRETIKTEDKES
ncbi:hypothetical protein [Peribacillus frigoritolerans]|uniref:hypothetical protein n=1 Tax=Peribacillus frigoritolerans TaxID=450367 RepID=UPI003017B78C